MPTLTNIAFKNFFKRLVQVDQATNTGFDNSARAIQDGDGVDSAFLLGKAGATVRPTSSALEGTATFNVVNNANDNVLVADTSNKLVKVNESQVYATTQFKEMGLYDFSPGSAGYHYPLIAHNMFIPASANSFEADADWGNGTDPPTTLDVSGLTREENLIACAWYLDNNIALDSVRFMATADASVTLNFHLFAYDMDTSTNHGDLSSGTVHANGSVSATATTVKTGTMTIDTANINANKVVIGFVENVTDTSDISVALTVKYHVR